MSAVTWYFSLVAAGILLLALEVIVPGAVLGVVGAVCLVLASMVGFGAFGAQTGALAALTLILATGIAMALWIRLFPRTPMGKALTLRTSGKDFKSTSHPRAELIGKTGEALCNLRPSGMASILGERVDVTAEHDFVAKGSHVVVTSVEGMRIIVKEYKDS